MWRAKLTLRLSLVVLPVITCLSRGEWMGLEDDAMLPCEFQVHVREDTPIGKVIFTLRRRNGDTTITNGSTLTTDHHQLLVNDRVVNTTNWDNTSGNASCSMTETIETLSSQSGYEGVRIVEGNKNDRFKVNAITGDILVNGYLDYDIDSEYTLKIALTSAPKTMQSTYSIEIVVDDVIDWPPYYNETCEMPTRGQQDGWTLPFTFLVGTLKVPLGRILRRPVDEFVEGDMNNGKCKLTAFSKARTKTQHHDVTDVNLQKCSSNGIHVRVYIHKHIELPSIQLANTAYVYRAFVS
ncbi:uncharacterized protein [Ptychodera flava]|uniref:uncharacterized protein n=1 Tax=Ptychodera flava TaxID=63121 RepID=UPI00396A40EC